MHIIGMHTRELSRQYQYELVSENGEFHPPNQT